MSTEYSTTTAGLRVQVNKVGGGTLGRAYEGEWLISVSDGQGYIFDSAQIDTPTAKTHPEVAEIALAFADDSEV